MTDEKQTQEQADEEMINQGFQELLDSYLAVSYTHLTLPTKA